MCDGIKTGASGAWQPFYYCDLAVSNRDGTFHHAPLTTKFTKQTEGLPWEVED